MRQKFVNKTYMRDTIAYNWLCEKNNELNAYICLKEIVKMKNPIYAYCNGTKYCGLNDGYTILEYIPKDLGYNLRVFFDERKRPLLAYFDINNGTGIENEIPWYDDLYLDIILSFPILTGGFEYISIDDEIELKNALKEEKISQEQFDKAWETANTLIRELKSHDNIFINRIQNDLMLGKNSKSKTLITQN